MKNVLTILKKELKRFFTDRRMLFAIFLPGIVIFAFYKMMGSFFQSNIFSSNASDVTYKIAYTDNYKSDTTELPKLLSVFDAAYMNTDTVKNANVKADYVKIPADKVSEYKEKIKSNEYTLLIEFTTNFEEQILATDPGFNNINIFFNGENSDSETLEGKMTTYIPYAYNNYMVNTEIKDGQAKLVETNLSESDGSAMASKIVGFVLPMITVSMLYSTVISFCPESISGEKERGTLASILMTPIKRSEYVIGKIIALSIVAALSGIVSFLGLVGSLPSLMGMTTLPLNVGQVILLLLIIISTLLLFVGFGVMVSAVANSVKEAASYLGPCTMLFMVLALIPSIAGLNSIGFAFIPVVNLAVCIGAVLSNAANVTLLFTFSIVTNLALTGLFIFIVTRLFNKERFVLGQ